MYYLKFFFGIFFFSCVRGSKFGAKKKKKKKKKSKSIQLNNMTKKMTKIECLCGNKFGLNSMTVSIDIYKQKIYFCQESCANLFLKNPLSYCSSNTITPTRTFMPVNSTSTICPVTGKNIEKITKNTIRLTFLNQNIYFYNQSSMFYFIKSLINTLAIKLVNLIY